MFKTCTLALKKSWKNINLVNPGSSKAEQKKDKSEGLQEDCGLRRDPRSPATKNSKVKPICYHIWFLFQAEYD